MKRKSIEYLFVQWLQQPLFTTSFSAMGAGAGVGGWRQENEKWKYYDASGILLTGWVKTK